MGNAPAAKANLFYLFLRPLYLEFFRRVYCNDCVIIRLQQSLWPFQACIVRYQDKTELGARESARSAATRLDANPLPRRGVHKAMKIPCVAGQRFVAKPLAGTVVNNEPELLRKI